MTDFHSHILPHIDDGSSNVEESIEMLKTLKQQGVDTVVATPHFYPQECSLDDFLYSREHAFGKLSPYLDDSLPDVKLGAEVYYYSGISRLDNIESLCIEDTRLLLVEMPMVRWTDFMVNELSYIMCCKNVKLVLAHIERYIDQQKRGVIESLVEQGALLQSNASFFRTKSSKRKALKMLIRGDISFIGTDCHNLEDRKPRMDEAIAVIREKYGDGFIRHFEDHSELYFNK